jgi:hypothetical protein
MTTTELLNRVEKNLEYLPQMKHRLDDLLLELRFERLKHPLRRPQGADATDK